MDMDFNVISLLVLALVVAVGFIKKINIGFFSVGAAFLLGMAGNLSAKAIVSGFSSSMFVTLVGVTFLFGMASANGTLDLFSKKVVALVGKRTYLIPILMFVLSAFISAIGPGHIAAGILMTTFAVYLAFELKINPMATALSVQRVQGERGQPAETVRHSRFQPGTENHHGRHCRHGHLLHRLQDGYGAVRLCGGCRADPPEMR